MVEGGGVMGTDGEGGVLRAADVVEVWHSKGDLTKTMRIGDLHIDGG